jgi:hypothetical protein
MAQLNKQYAKQRANPGFRQKKVVRTKYRRTWGELGIASTLLPEIFISFLEIISQIAHTDHILCIFEIL